MAIDQFLLLFAIFFSEYRSPFLESRIDRYHRYQVNLFIVLSRTIRLFFSNHQLRRSLRCNPTRRKALKTHLRQQPLQRFKPGTFNLAEGIDAMRREKRNESFESSQTISPISRSLWQRDGRRGATSPRLFSPSFRIKHKPSRKWFPLPLSFSISLSFSLFSSPFSSFSYPRFFRFFVSPPLFSSPSLSSSLPSPGNAS